MDSNSRCEDILSQVKDELNKNNIKLWLHPYYDEDSGVGIAQDGAFQVLCEQITSKLNINKEHCMAALKELQSHALDRLNANKVYKDTGMASLRVKLTGEHPRIVLINICLTDSAQDLIQEVSNMINIHFERIKVISQGRVLQPPESLTSQGVKNGSLLMAVIMADSDQLQKSEKRLKTLESTKKDIHLLAGRSNSNHESYMQIENQSGEALDLPYYEKKALVTAMAFHEKGRAALNNKDYSLALVMFLEADKEYSECTSQLLGACDNYALLQLDIAWCYLCLRNPSQIPDADRRLTTCEQSFHKSYGPNLERLLAIKGSTGNEAALFMRLHLLQGVVLFHRNNRAEARSMFERAQSELNRLKVDDNNVCLLMELGFTSNEARRALRATYGNIEAAEELMERRRREQDLTRERNRLKLKYERERNKLGLCVDGMQFCEPSGVQKLVSMGFDERQSVAALKQTNNNLSEAIALIQDSPHLLPGCSQSVSQESIAQVASLGFDPDDVREALETFPELEKSVKSLSALVSSPDAAAAASVPTMSASAMSFLEEVRKKRKARDEEEAQAFMRISEGLVDNDSPDDHLDLSLAQEEEFLAEYLSLFN